jgi:hypothetical protein
VKIKLKIHHVWLQLKCEMAADRVLKRFSRQIRKEDASISCGPPGRSFRNLLLPNMGFDTRRFHRSYQLLVYSAISYDAMKRNFDRYGSQTTKQRVWRKPKADDESVIVRIVLAGLYDTTDIGPDDALLAFQQLGRPSQKMSILDSTTLDSCSKSEAFFFREFLHPGQH